MSKKIKSLFCVILSITILCSSMLFSANVAEAVNNNEYKIDSVLKDKLDNMSDDEQINISVWLTDIDTNDVEEKVNVCLSNDIKENSITRASVDLVFKNNEISEVSLNEDDLLTNEYINDNDSYSSDVTLEQVQTVINTERQVASSLYQQQNEEFCDSLLSETKSAYTNKKQSKLPQVIYSCKYAPNVELYISKKQIYDLIDSTLVEKVYYSDINCDMVTDDSIADYTTTETTAAETETYNTAYFNMTGISTARDAWSLSGNGITVGIFDAAFTKPDKVDYLNSANVDYSLVKEDHLSDDYSAHGSFMACLIAGLKKDGSTVIYKGAVPNAKVYCAAGYIYKKSLEELVEKGCNVINMSLSHITEYNSYGDISKWIDHLSVMHKVHFVCSAGNYGSNGIYSSNMGYNAIVVGNCSNTGEIKSSSSYVVSDTLAYKPDLVAPGANAVAPPVGNSSSYSSGGTSAASAIVCGAVAQLCQASPTFCANPALLKSALLASAKRKYGSTTMSPLSAHLDTSIALSHIYGAGLLSVTNAYTSFIDTKNYRSSTFSPHSLVASFNIRVSNVSSTNQKLLRVALVWDKVNTITNEHMAGAVVSPELDLLKLKVTTPSGEVYTSEYFYDTKQYVSFIATEAGSYTVDIIRTGATSSNQFINYAFAYTVQSE